MGSPSITEQAERPYISIEHLPHLPDPHLHAWTAVADIRLRSPPARPSATGRRPAWLMVLSVMLWSGAFGILTGLTSPAAQAQQTAATLFQGVRIFDGKSGALSAPSNVLIRDNKIEKISAAPIAADGARTI